MEYILHIVAALFIGGAEKVACDIGLYCDYEKYENHYVVFDNEAGIYESQLKKRGCKIFRLPPPSESYRSYINNLTELMEQYDYKAVHAHTMFNAGWAMMVAKKMGVPVRVAHAHSALDVRSGAKTKIYEALMRNLILSDATDLVACSEKAGIRLFGERAYRQRGQLILNGIDTKRFQYSLEKRNRIRQELNIENNYVIGHVGHLAEVKNQSFLLEIMPEILKIKPNAMLLLLGDGNDKEMLRAKIQKHHLDDKVIMTGNVVNVQDYLSAMDVFAFPSLYEGMPLSIIEVQANGLPCVLSTGVPEDVYLTDLIHPLPLAEQKKWVRIICSLHRSEPDKYSKILFDLGYDITSVVKKFYSIYENE